MRFRAGDDIIARIRASVTRRDHRGTRPPRDQPPAPRPPMAQVTYYGKLGEMGHAADRADDFGPADTGVRAVRPPVDDRGAA